MSVGLVIFDCDGVLIESERLAVELDIEMLEELGWEMTREQVIERFMGRSYEHMLGQIEEYLGHPVEPDWTTRWDQRYQDLLAAELEPVEGIAEVVDALRDEGLAMCVASSSGHESLKRNLSTAGLYDRFAGRIYSGSEVEHGKPAPDLFLHAAASMGFTVEQCVVVEDSRYGVAAARAAGMPCFAFAAGAMTPLDALEGPGTTIFYEMSALPGLIAAL